MAKTKSEKRRPIICPYCHSQMVCMNRFESVSSLTKGLYIWYVCPRRRQERGCGYSALMQVSARTKQPIKTVFSVKLKRFSPKKKTKGKGR